MQRAGYKGAWKVLLEVDIIVVEKYYKVVFLEPKKHLILIVFVNPSQFIKTGKN